MNVSTVQSMFPVALRCNMHRCQIHLVAMKMPARWGGCVLFCQRNFHTFGHGEIEEIDRNGGFGGFVEEKLREKNNIDQESTIY